MFNLKNWLICAAISVLAFTGFSCGGSSQNSLRVEGSDTMVNVAQAWAEAYAKVKPGVDIEVSGGGSGVGIAAIIDGQADIANSSRKMKAEELKLAKQNTGKKPVEFIVGSDALAVYVHKDNPIESISIEELAQIYGDGGSITTWKQLGVKHTGCASDAISIFGRQNSSGTYAYFRKAVLNNKDYKGGIASQSGSKDVVAVVSKTPCAIGYSGMGYRTGGVKWLKISAKKGQNGIEPSVKAAMDKSYLISRPLYIYTLGQPTGAVKEYLDWIKSDAGQQIVLKLGYVPIRDLK